MNKIKLTAKQKDLIERFGAFHEQSGHSSVEARISALLLVSDNVELTFDEIYQTLGISKSAVSNALNYLLKTEKIEYSIKIGSRKRYFKTRLIQMKFDHKKNMERFFLITTFLKEVLENRTKTTKEFNDGLKNIIDFMAFMQQEMPGIIKKWELKKKK